MNQAAIQTTNLSKAFGAVLAVQDVSLSAYRGEVYGFLGLNGAGKSTTLRLILGMLRPDRGDIRVLGHSLQAGKPGPWEKVGYAVEGPSAWGELTVRENLHAAALMHGLKDPHRINDVVHELGLKPFENRRAGTLSSGNKQRLSLARALLHRPDLVILDEPSNGLDPAGMAEIRSRLRALAKKEGCAVLMSSHLLSEVEETADRVGILHHGRLLKEVSRKALKTLRKPTLVLVPADSGKGRRALKRAGVTYRGSAARMRIDDPSWVKNPERAAAALAKAGTLPRMLVVQREGLESLFMRLTGGRKS